MGCRKNQASLTAAEKSAFTNAVLALKTRPSQTGLANRYDDYVKWHVDSMNSGGSWAHRRPAFLPWHREFLRRFELDLQAIDPTVNLPYWDWTVDNQATSSIWNADLMGGNGQGATHKVMTGPFAFDAGNWTINVHDPNDGGQGFLKRAFGTDAAVTTLPTSQNVVDCLTETPYDETPWNESNTLASFRNRLEGWYGLGSIHNRVHRWVGGDQNTGGGTMLFAASPNDPVFWMHHCNVDRLWGQWQLQHPSEVYHPTGVGPDTGPAGHNLPDSMQPWGGTTTVAGQQNHHALGYWYDTDPSIVTLTTPSLSFVDVPEGLGGAGITTYRAMVFEVQSCQPVTLSIIAGPTGGFSATALGTSTIVQAGGPGPGIGRLWIAYTSTSAGDVANGSVTVAQTGSANQWVVSLTANTIARPRSAVALALDRSGSMSQPAGDGTTKHAKLLEAVEIFVDTMSDGDGLAIVSFDDQIARLLDVTDVGPQPAVPGSGRASAATILAGSDLDPRGMTAIGGAVVEGQDALADAQAVASPPYDVQALVVLTDGIENVSPYLSTITPSITARTFAVGLGLPTNISATALDALAAGTGGYLLVTGAMTTDQQFRLSKYFLQVLAGITNADVVVDPVGELVYGPTHRIPFQIGEYDYGLDAILTSPLAPIVDFKLEAPDGTIIDPGAVAVDPAASYVGRRLVSYYRLPLPTRGGQGSPVHAGRWTALLTLDKRVVDRHDDLVRTHARVTGRRSVPYNLVVHSHSSLRLSALVDRAVAAPGEAVEIVATLNEYGLPVSTRAVVWAEILEPTGFTSTVNLTEASAGTYHGRFTAGVQGLHHLRVRAAGTSLYGTPFTREQGLSVAAVRAGDGLGDPFRELIDRLEARDERMCELLTCLATDEAALERLGLDARRLAECLKAYCRPMPKRHADETRSEQRDRPIVPTRPAPLSRATAEEPPISSLVEPEAPPPEPEMQHPMTGPMFGLSAQDIAAGEQAIRDAKPKPKPGRPRTAKPSDRQSRRREP